MKTWMIQVLRTLPILFLLWMVEPAHAVAQCPMCKAAVESGSDGGENKLVAGLNTGIIYLFILPYSAIMLLGVVLYLAYRRRRRAQAREEMVTLESMTGIGNTEAPPSGA